MSASPVLHTKQGKQSYALANGSLKTHYVTLDFESSTYWLFEATDVPDPVFPDAWKNSIARFCRWWVTDNERQDDLRDVSGILQLMSPLSALEVHEHIDAQIGLFLFPCTLAHQAGFIPQLTHCQKFVQHEYGEQRFPKSVMKLPSYNTPLTPAQQRYANIAIRYGMNSREARDPEKVREFFRLRRLNKHESPMPTKRQRTNPPPAPVKHLTQSLGDIPDYSFDGSDGHISSDDEINNL